MKNPSVSKIKHTDDTENHSLSDWYSDATLTLLHDLEHECKSLSSMSQWKSNIYKCISILIIFSIVLLGAAVGILGILSTCSDVLSYIASALGFCITGIKTLDSVFTVEKKAILLRDISNKANRIVREVSKVKIIRYREKKLLHKIEEWHSELDNLDLSSFDSTVTFRARRISPRSKYGSSDSDTPPDVENVRNILPMMTAIAQVTKKINKINEQETTAEDKAVVEEEETKEKDGNIEIEMADL